MGKLQISIPEELHEELRAECLRLSTTKKRYSQERLLIDYLQTYNSPHISSWGNTKKKVQPPKEAKEDKKFKLVDRGDNGIVEHDIALEEVKPKEPTVVSKEEEKHQCESCLEIMETSLGHKCKPKKPKCQCPAASNRVHEKGCKKF